MIRLVEGVRETGFAEGGNKVVVHGRDGFIKTWVTDEFPLQREPMWYGGKVNGLVAQPGGAYGRHVASSADDDTVRIWDPRTGLCVYFLSGHVKGAHTLAFSCDGMVLTRGSGDGMVFL
jgi:WD40 repeat protein